MRRWRAAALVIVGPALPLPAQTRLPDVPKHSPALVPAGPASLTAGSSVTGQIWLSFPWVENAREFRVTRSSNAPEPERTLYEGDVGRFGRDEPAAVYHDAPVSPGSLFVPGLRRLRQPDREPPSRVRARRRPRSPPPLSSRRG